MKLSILREPTGFRFLWEPLAAPGAAKALAREARCRVDAALEADLARALDLAASSLDRLGRTVDPGGVGEAGAEEDSLALAGSLIHTRLLPGALREDLASLAPGTPISLCLDARSAALPWELCHDGQDFLALRHAPGRQLLWDGATGDGRSDDIIGQRALLVGNPSGDLAEAEAEVEALMERFDAAGEGIECELLCRGQASRLRFLEALASGRYRLLHLACHARPDAILLADGWLEAEEIRQALAGKPLVYLNACRSAGPATGRLSGRVSEDASEKASEETAGRMVGRASGRASERAPELPAPPLGLVEAFLAGGALALVGTRWAVYDDRAAAFSRSFYGALLDRLPLGSALRRARLESRAHAPREAAWAAPLLHGDPRARVFAPGLSQHAASALVLRWPALPDSSTHDPTPYPSTASAASSRSADPLERLRLASALITARGGRLAEIAPDRLLACFGLPRTLEDDAARAFDCALSLLESGAGAQAAIGIASSEIHLDESGLGVHALPLYFGPAVEQASELADLGRPGRALVTADSARLAGRAYSLREARPDEDFDPSALPASDPRPAAALSPDRATDDPSTPRTGTADAAATLDTASAASSAASPAVPLAGTATASERSTLPTPLVLLRRAASDRPAAPPAGVGREAELDRLRTALLAARSGRGAILGIAGEAGMGKSHLMARFRAETDAGTDRWLALEPGPDAAPYSALAALLSQLGTAGPASPAEASPGEARLARLLDLLLERPEALPGLEMQAEDRGILLHYLRGRLAAGPEGAACLLWIDGAERLDAVSLEIFERLAQGIERGPLLLLCAYRPGWQHPFFQQPAYQQIHLGPLDEADARGLVALRLGMEAEGALPAGLDALLERAAGNPFFIEEILRDWREQGMLRQREGLWQVERPAHAEALPASIRRILLARCDRLDPAARRALEAAALLDAPFSPDLLGRLLGERSTEAAVDALESRAYLSARWATGELALRHRLVGEILVDGMSPARRRGLHRRAAQALAGAGGSSADRIERIAGHRMAAVTRDGRADSPEDAAGEGRAEPGPSSLAIFEEASAEDLRAAVDALLRAGRQALERHAARRAAGHHRRALAILAQLPAAEAERWIDADEGLGDALNQLGAFEAAILHYRAAFARPSGSEAAARRRKADLARRIGRLLGWGAQYDEALGWMERGLALLGEQLDEPSRGLAALIQIHSGAIHYYRGDLDEAAGHIQRGLGLAEGSAHRLALATGYNALGTVHDAKGLRDRAIEAYARSLELWQEQGDSYQAARVADNLGICRFHLGQWEAAAEHHRQALDFFEALEDRDQAAFAGLNLGNVFLARGQWEGARQHFSRALARGEEVGSPRLQLIARINLGLLGLESGDAAAAGPEFERALDLQSAFEITDFAAEILCARARLALSEGHVESAERLARQALEAAREVGLALEEGAAHMVLGAALSALDQHAPARQHLRWALGIFDGLAQAHEAARARLAGATAAHRAGQGEEASQLLMEARQRFEGLGAAADLARSIGLEREWEQSDVA